MSRKTMFIANLAASLRASGSTMSFNNLANYLNGNGFRTGYGTMYTGGRGVARVVNAAYYELERAGYHSDKHNVANAFVGKYGDLAW